MADDTEEQRNTIQRLSSLFVNREDCYCIQLQRGYTRVEQPLTDYVLLQHLKGEVTVGSYQLDKDSRVKWLCFDIDPERLEDAKATAERILAVLLETEQGSEGNETPRVWPNCIVLEASRYPDPSYHIWVLFLLPVKAKVARWLGLRVLEVANVSPKTVEVFPKQEEITADRPFGNFVKLPFGKHQTAQKWSRMLDFGTFEPLPLEELESKHGLSFSEKDTAKLEGMETKRNVQVTFELPKNFKTLSDSEEEKAVRFLCKYWREGARNQLEMYFLGLCIKKGVSFESAKRVISEVANRTKDSEKQARLDLVAYHYRNRANVSLKGSSGIREIIQEMLMQ
ncbi:hypothetical protein G4O51_09340 [Candidatus Bathyarchaeota archaeon A05DMB-2]|jgi:hypothetical protein|nr:hypothetical protein [Candidatus Bathyarchaeota archaeon A05DMB-2]